MVSSSTGRCEAENARRLEVVPGWHGGCRATCVGLSRVGCSSRGNRKAW